MTYEWKSRKDGRHFRVPKGQRRNYSQPQMEVVAVKQGFWKKGESELDSEERYTQYLEIESIVARINSSNPITSSMAKAELKQKYTDVYEEMYGKEVDETEQAETPEGELIGSSEHDVYSGSGTGVGALSFVSHVGSKIKGYSDESGR